jgi:YesN/AraC family two-component response regulator
VLFRAIGGSMIKASKLLLVDDEEELIENLIFDLRDDINSFLIGCNGKEALKVYKENKHDITCIITDLNMPVMNGLKFIEEIRKIDLDVPVVFLTAHGDENKMKLALSLNAFDFLSKPYNISELKEMIHSIHEDYEIA